MKHVVLLILLCVSMPASAQMGWIANTSTDVMTDEVTSTYMTASTDYDQQGDYSTAGAVMFLECGAGNDFSESIALIEADLSPILFSGVDRYEVTVRTDRDVPFKVQAIAEGDTILMDDLREHVLAARDRIIFRYTSDVSGETATRIFHVANRDEVVPSDCIAAVP